MMELPGEISPVAGLLNTEIRDRDACETYIKTIDLVLKGKSESEEIYGNICGIKIKKDLTHVFQHLADDGLGYNCYIKTEELRKLVLVWIDEFIKHKEEKIKQKEEKINEFIYKIIESDEQFRDEILKIMSATKSKVGITIKKDKYKITVYDSVVIVINEDEKYNILRILPEKLKESINNICQEKSNIRDLR